MRNKGLTFPRSILLSAIISVIVWGQYDVWSLLGLGVCVMIFLLYVYRLNETIPVLELMLFLSAIQWVYGAHQSYNFEYEHYKYYMYVEREDYMYVVVPGLIAFIFGVLIFKKTLNINEVSEKLHQFVRLNPKAPLILVAIGFFAPFVGRFMPVALSFIFFLLGNLKFIGAALWLFKPEGGRKWLATAAIMLFTFLGAIQAGMFHDLLLWMALLFSFVVYNLKISYFNRLALIAGGFLFVFLVQSVKAEYRARLWDGLITNQTPTEVFFEMVQDRFSNLSELVSSDEYMAEMNVRLNQGWIISAIIDNVPNMEPYANGETIIEAISGSLLPRFLVPDKKIAGGRENFERFTGLPLGAGTSMGTSVIGEAYANFGPMGSWIFMFFWGMFLSLGFNKLISYGKKNPLIYVFIPLIFLQVVKAETELYVVLNHFLKSLILVFGLLWFFKKYMGWKYEVEVSVERSAEIPDLANARQE